MKKAFTLIELLVVIAIIAILAAMLMPALSKAKSEAMKASCTSNVHNLGLAWSMFRKEHNEEWTREKCVGWDTGPESIADLAGLGYIKDMDVYMCPAFENPYHITPTVIRYPTDISETGLTQGKFEEGYTGEIDGITYFADEARISRESVSQRAVLADGIRMLTNQGKVPANHADHWGHAVGANVLFVDNVVKWIDVYRPEHEWVMDKADSLEPGGIGWCKGETWYPHVTGGTWRRFGYIQNVRLLQPDPNVAGEYVGGGEDSLLNDYTAHGDVEYADDVDDIYYVECDSEADLPGGSWTATWGETFGDDCKWGFFAPARGARCTFLRDKSKRDCSLAGGHLWWWRSSTGIYNQYPEFEGTEGWGWPDEYQE